jgi:hypothetical protein
MGESEVARLRRQIELEYEAMQRGLTGFAAGAALHKFIQARMEHIGSQQDKLAGYVGEKEAAHIAAELYMKVMEE